MGLIIIDYLQLMQGETKKNSNREQEISTISRSLKALAKELNIPVIALSQLSRDVEKRAELQTNTTPTNNTNTTTGANTAARY